MKIVIIQDCGVEDNEGHFDSGNTTIVWEVKEAQNE